MRKILDEKILPRVESCLPDLFSCLGELYLPLFFILARNVRSLALRRPKNPAGYIFIQTLK